MTIPAKTTMTTMTTRTPGKTGRSFLRRAVAAVTAAGVIGLGGVSLMPQTAEAAGVTTRQAAYATVPASTTVAADKGRTDD